MTDITDMNTPAFEDRMERVLRIAESLLPGFLEEAENAATLIPAHKSAQWAFLAAQEIEQEFWDRSLALRRKQREAAKKETDDGI